MSSETQKILTTDGIPLEESLKKAEKNKARIKNGLEMLYTQAEISWELWNK